jgi:hypothetical protein
LRKWNGNPGEVFADQAVTPSQEQAENAPTAGDLRQGIFRQHRPIADIAGGGLGVRFLGDTCCKSRKLQGSRFFAKTLSGERSLIRMTSIALPKSPVNFA